MERGGRVLLYPPIYDEIDEWGDQVYRVVFRHGQGEIIGFGGQLPREESHQQVRELLRQGLRDGTYAESYFYPEDPNDMYYMQRFPYYVNLGGRGMEVEQGNAAAAHGHGRVGGVRRAPGEAVLGLPETSLEEGECSVCLMGFETGSKVRVMPCSHYFHQQCIFTWLQHGHVCPLCRFPLPTEHK